MVIDSHEHSMFLIKMQLEKMDAAGVDKTVLFCTAPHPEKAGTLNELEEEMAAFASIATRMALTELPERCLYSSDAPYGEPYLYRLLIEFVSSDKRAAEMALGENIPRLLELN